MIQRIFKTIQPSLNHTWVRGSKDWRRRGIASTAFRMSPIVPFPLADIGEGIAEVEILEWFVKEGDKIAQFDAVCQVQSDKATVDITSRYDGTVAKIHYSVGDMASVGKPLIDIETDALGAQEETPPSTSKTTPVQQPPVIEPSPELQTPETVPEPAILTSEPSNVSRRVGRFDKVLTVPSVRRLAKEHGIDLGMLVGSGKDGRLMKSDVLEAIKVSAGKAKTELKIDGNAELAEYGAKPFAPQQDTKESIRTKDITEDQVIPIKGVQRIMVKSMSAALKIPHFGYADEVFVDALFDLRQQLLPLAEQQNLKLTFLPFFLKAASLAIKQYPILNSTMSECEAQYTVRSEHNISIAMDTPKGLLVPNIKSVQTKSIFEIAQDIARLQVLASEGKLGEEEMKGGTFTISNIGSIGGTYMNPVILIPQVCIGAIGRFQMLPRYSKDGTLQPVRLANVSWSGDHRIIDGATMARFSNLWKVYLENPMSMLAELK